MNTPHPLGRSHMVKRQVKWLLLLAGVLFGANAVYFLMSRDRGTSPPVPPPHIEAAIPVARTPTVVLPSLPAITITRQSTPLLPSQMTAAPTSLLLPVHGVPAGHLSDTFADARGSNRVHNAIDIMAPHGTPVLAATDGHVEKLHESKGGGLSLYQFDPDNTFVYYYAHLQGYAPGITEGKQVRRGEVVGFVGSTGNANAAAPHLHFAVSQLGPEQRWHQGTPINPYPLLVGSKSAPLPRQRIDRDILRAFH